MSYHALNRYYLRKDFSRIKKVMEKPSLLDVQRKSYEEILQRYTKPQDRGHFGLQAVFKSVFPFKDFSETAFLEYVSYTLGEPKYDVDECRQKELTYAVPLKVMLRLVVWDVNAESGSRSINEPALSACFKRLHAAEAPSSTYSFLMQLSNATNLGKVSRDEGLV